MRKEVILAITIGFALGLIITYGVWLANKSLKSLPASPDTSPTPSPEVSTSSTPSPTGITTSPLPTSKPSGSLSLTITEPADEILSDKDTITLKGTTAPNAIVAITDENSQTTISADTNGAFSASIKLEGGYNTITVVAFDKSGNSATQSLIVTYTTAKI